MKKRTFVMLLALVLVFGVVAGGTLAYLNTKTKTVTNTFVAGEIGTLDLTEKKNTHTTGENVAGDFESAATKAVTNEYLVVPGVGILKDPQVKFTKAEKNNVAVYVFVKVDGWTSTDNETYTTTVADGKSLSCTVDTTTWKELDATKYPGVYYKALEIGEELSATSILTKTDDVTISVPASITAAELKAATLSNLTFTAYAIQQEAFENVAAAWAEVSK